MKTWTATVAAAALLWWTAAGRAGEPISAPHDFAVGGASQGAATISPPVTASPVGAMPAGPGCAACAGCCNEGRHGATCWEWLTYQPLHKTHCGECKACCAGPWPRLYLFFLGQCQEHPCTACGGGCSSCGWPGHGFSGTPTGVGFVNH